VDLSDVFENTAPDAVNDASDNSAYALPEGGSIVSAEGGATVVRGEIVAEGNLGSSVDHWTFHHNGGSLTVDTLSESGDQFTDIDGDGVKHHIDTMMRLYDSEGNQVAVNDDSSQGTGDGSTNDYYSHIQDSYISISDLPPGDYTLAIGSWELTEQEVANDHNDNTSSTNYDHAQDTGPYQITLTGDIAFSQGPDLTTDEDTGLTIQAADLLGNDSDVDGDTLTIASVQDASHGTVVLNDDGSVTFTPEADYHGEAGFSYTISDGQGGIDTAQVALNVDAVNDNVSVVTDADASANTVVENAANGTEVGITATADDVDGDNVSFSLVDADGNAVTDGPFAVDGTTGVVTVRDGSQLDYETRTSHDIHVKASSADGSSSIQTFTVAVADVDENHAPDAVNDSTGGGGAGTVLASENFDGDVSGWGSQVSAHNGQMAIGKDESATKTFDFGAEHANQAVVIEFDLVASENDPYNGGLGWDSWGDKQDYFTVTVNGMQEARDSYGDGQTDNIAVHYRVETTTDANGQVALDLNLDATGEYEVAYIDNFSIEAGNDWTAPLSTDEDVGLTIQAADLLGNDSDVDGDSLTIASVQDASHGAVVLNDDGSITFTPEADYHGDASFSYTVSDGQGGSDTAQVALNVDAVNDNVSVVTDADASANSVVENAADGTEVGITATAEDVDGDNVSFSLVDADGNAVTDGPFAVDGTTGVVTVHDGSQLDYETQTSHEIHIQATSDDGSSSIQTFTVGVKDAVYGGDGDDIFAYDPAGDVGYFDGGTGGGWTDVIDLSEALAGAEDPENPWTIMVDGEHVEFDIASHALELNPDTSGVVELADGSELAFHGVEKIEW
jgi:predicted thioesterase